MGLQNGKDLSLCLWRERLKGVGGDAKREGVGHLDGVGRRKDTLARIRRLRP
jgi:hypothetical protein